MSPATKTIDVGGQLPVTILTGFLGSGKTTLLSRLLKTAALTNTAVIVNELGDVGLDHILVQAPADEMVLLNDGCVCCSIRGDLVITLQELLAKRITGELPPFERVVVETTGLADPAPLLQTIITDDDIKDHLKLDGVVTVVDAVNGFGQLDRHFESVKQAAVADRIVISKVDLVDTATLNDLEARLQRLNPSAHIFAAVHGELPPERLFGLGLERVGKESTDVESWLSEAAHDQAARAGQPHATAHHHAPSGVHRHDDGVCAFSIRYDGTIHPAGVKLWLDLLSAFQGPRLLRVKGLLNVMGEPLVVHVVQHLSHPPVMLDGWPDDERHSRIVFITHDLDRATIEQTLEALSFSPGRASHQRLIDPGDYAQFTRILERVQPTSGQK